MAVESRSCARIKRVTHQFEFDYLKLKHLPCGQRISSPPFSVGGYDWVLDFYPHGSEQERDGSHTSLYLRLLSQKKKAVHVESSFVILDNKGKPVLFGEPLSDTYITYPDTNNNWGYIEFLPRDEIEACYCKDGVLVISCNIRILSALSGLCEDIKKVNISSDVLKNAKEADG